MDVVYDAPPAADQRIDELHCWIATYANGSEGLISADFTMPGAGLRLMPLLASRRDLADRMGALARTAQRGPLRDTIVSVRLCTFARRFALRGEP